MNTVSITSQGQVTIPVAVRRAWGIENADKLQAHYDEETKTLALRPYSSFDEVIQTLSSFSPKKDREFLADVSDFYETHRAADVGGVLDESIDGKS
ncbi:AbrB/MazE/SpoVT family DNA-binding domain-containing protein [Actinotignum urinale]|uniref:AbrB/MazE/SpoVT family DNA-binding domain-containing protein n=1 Tax=Actinotignum urinale TaxID=190146 RepID=A0AAW9HZ37_9ACTO|nr:AbrB/MazE/SpoVT family DNA-binding domain-containing protein [Actinotignum urinale]MDY5128525.1 AbrB/MazE/SpoVT family DNA-binding domain-containing protein [Actinotignum urinale]MDY5132640.1 AbrB/MazE/SpoVT family DNA-binding domain-containing protein [Actinotignum urinale]MDY5151269.1 AbrB/MazE/SpoVT family DNA-binding domain-containing protein [Actinotignum urinale]MDY5155111.1 AbrB/MazE/SpoVT family DNA-binding domain-containing protein [Actinotignum urinale]MDY5160614.1 AbrB/MazE/SpoVT